MKREFLDTPDGQIHYATEGSGDPVLLLHQTPRSMDEYRELAPLLAKSMRAIAVDSIGYGDTYKPAGPVQIQDFARNAIRVLDHLGIQQTSLVGIHTGALISTELMAAYPERVSKAVIYSPPLIDEGGRAAFPRLMGEDMVKDEFEWKVREDGSHIRGLWHVFRNYAWTGTPPWLATRLVLDALKAGEQYVALGLEAVLNYTNTADRMKLIQCPTLVAVASNNLFGESGDPSQAGKLIPRSKVVPIEGGTPAVMNLMPEKYSQMVLEFFANPGI